MTQATPAAEVLGGGRSPRTRIGIGLIGFGWLGQAHSRSLAACRRCSPTASSTPSW